MTIKEYDDFVKTDTKQYILTQNLEFMNWFYEKLKSGYYPILSLEGMQKLIDKTVAWYEFKLPNRFFAEADGITSERFAKGYCKPEDMSFKDLLYRYTEQEINFFEANYRGRGGFKLWNKDITYYFTACMIDNPKRETIFDVEQFMIPIETSTGQITKGDLSFLEDIDEELYNEIPSLINVEELYCKIRNYMPNANLSDLERIICIHDYDIELRERVFNLIALALIYSENTIPEYGLERAHALASEVPRTQIKVPSIEDLMKKETSKPNAKVLYRAKDRIDYYQKKKM